MAYRNQLHVSVSHVRLKSYFLCAETGEFTLRYSECAVKAGTSGCKQKDDVQTRDEGFHSYLALGESHHRTDGRRDNTKMLNELEEQGAAGQEGILSQEMWKGVKRKWEKVEETQLFEREEQEVDGWVWRCMREALCEEIRVCECVCDGSR